MKRPSILKILLRGVCIFFVGLFVYGMCWGILNLVEEEDYLDVDTVDMVRWCDDDYYGRNYADLYDMLTLYDLEGETYDKYWDLVNGYIDYQNYIMWEKAEAAGVENAVSYVEEYYNKVESNAVNCKYPLHKPSLQQFFEEIKK